MWFRREELSLSAKVHRSPKAAPDLEPNFAVTPKLGLPSDLLAAFPPRRCHTGLVAAAQERHPAPRQINAPNFVSGSKPSVAKLPAHGELRTARGREAVRLMVDQNIPAQLLFASEEQLKPTRQARRRLPQPPLRFGEPCASRSGLLSRASRCTFHLKAPIAR